MKQAKQSPKVKPKTIQAKPSSKPRELPKSGSETVEVTKIELDNGQQIQVQLKSPKGSYYPYLQATDIPNEALGLVCNGFHSVGYRLHSIVESYKNSSALLFERQ